MKPAALVTGGAGFIGSHLVTRLLQDGWYVTVVDDFSTAPLPRDLYVKEVIPGGVSLVDRSIAEVSYDEIDLRLGYDAIFHLASVVGPVEVLRHPGKIAYRTMVDTAKVREWAFEANCPIIDVSTSEVYGGGKDGLCSEAMPRVFAPGHSARMEYAVAKLAAETMLLNTPDLDVRIIRPFNVAGPRQSSRGGFVLPRFVSQAMRGDPVTIYQPGTQRRAFTHVLDVVDGIMLIYEKAAPKSIYNIGNPNNLCDISQLASEVVSQLGSSSPQIVVDPRDIFGPDFREAADKYPDASRAISELGWKPTRDRRVTIRDVAEYMEIPGRLALLGA